MKTLVGELPLLAGERVAHPDLRIGYFAQHTVESLHEGQTPDLATCATSRRTPASSSSAISSASGISSATAPSRSVDGFSGGERARLALALIAYRSRTCCCSTNRPTTSTSTCARRWPKRSAIFAGAIVLVSHDRHLIGLVCETFWRVADGKVEAFDGDLDEYAAWLRARGGSESKAAKSAEKVAAAVPVVAKTVRSKQAVDADSKRFKAVEARIAAIQSEAKHIEDELADPAVYNSDGGATLAQLGQRQASPGQGARRARGRMAGVVRIAGKRLIPATRPLPGSPSAPIFPVPAIQVPTMPIYGFECASCGHQFDRLQKLSDPDPELCPECGAPQVRRQLTAPTFRLAGGGWYETDFKKDGDKKRNLVDKAEVDAEAEAKPDAKPAAAAPETKPAKPATTGGTGSA